MYPIKGIERFVLAVLLVLFVLLGYPIKGIESVVYPYTIEIECEYVSHKGN